jgi:hypothetical protein
MACDRKEYDQWSNLTEVQPAEWKVAADRLNDVGVFADEERRFPGPSTIRRELEQFETKVRSRGYTGRPLSIAEIDRPKEGVDFVIFDRTRIGDHLTAVATWSQDYAARWQERVEAGIADWIKRLNDLKATIQGWLPPDASVVDRPPTRMHEELMKRFRVPPAEMPTFEILQGERRLMRVQPKGLWIVGANGRVDLITPTRSLILVDRSRPLSGYPDWWFYAPDNKSPIKLGRDQFLKLLT